jgi:hypothetical protein
MTRERERDREREGDKVGKGELIKSTTITITK